MKFIISADWHIRNTRPRCRIDEDWIETQRKILNEITKISIENDASVMVVGDLFHSNSDTSFECIQMIQEMAEKLNGLYILAGNHDLPYHSSQNIEKSAIGVLLKSNNVHLIKDYFDELHFNSGEKILFSASNFDEKDYENAKIIFKHVLVFPDVKSMPPNFDGMTAKELLSEFPQAKWIFTGDYHHNFHYEKNHRHVVNPGCILRQASDMKDYKPGVYLVDTDSESVKFILLNDSENLVDDSYITADNEREERIDSFVSKLKNTKSISLNFTENVEQAILENDFSEEFVDIINELMEI